jgi:hypothetical protein
MGGEELSALTPYAVPVAAAAAHQAVRKAASHSSRAAQQRVAPRGKHYREEAGGKWERG